MSSDDFEKTFSSICVEKPKKKHLDAFTNHPDREAVKNFLIDKLRYYAAPDSDYFDKYDEWGIIHTVKLLGDFKATACTELLMTIMDEIKNEYDAILYSYTINALSKMGESAIEPVYTKYQEDRDDSELSYMWLSVLAKLGVKDTKITDAIKQHYKSNQVEAINLMGDYGDMAFLPIIQKFVKTTANLLNARQINPFEFGIRFKVPEAEAYIETRENLVLLETGLSVGSREFDEKVKALDRELLDYAFTAPNKGNGDLHKFKSDINLQEMHDTLELMFAELDIQSTFGRTVAILLGGHCYPETLSMGILFPKIYNRDDVEFDSKEQLEALVNTIMSTWNYFVDCKNPDEFEFLQYTDNIENFTKDRTVEISAFLDVVLYRGSSDINSYTKESQIEINFIQEEYQYLKNITSDKNLLSSTPSVSVQDRVLQVWQKMFVIKRCETEHRQRSIRDGSHQARIVKKKIGRNDPCFCGSGKKYKHCCLN